MNAMKSESMFSRNELRELMVRFASHMRTNESFRLISDTTNFFKVDYGDVVLLEGIPYLISGCEREGRFGLEDEPKYWVRRAIDLTCGAMKVVKFVFREEFETQIGEVFIRRFRSPRKEAHILDLVKSQPNFMQGRGVFDSAGNLVRILEFIRGPRYDEIVPDWGNDHLDYFNRFLPGVLEQFIELVLAIKFLHDNGEKHGDIRRDHIIRDEEHGFNRWIDFDYDYQHGESVFSLDLQGLGNILVFLVGRGDVLLPDLKHDSPDIFSRLTREDINILFRNRVANLGKVFPYLPESLNRTLRHFSAGAPIFYDSTDQLLEDLAESLAEVTALTGGLS